METDMAGNLYVVAAPSGAGKTTLVCLLLEREPAVHLSISFTTGHRVPASRMGVNIISLRSTASKA